MATVTGYTAERMDEIVADNIIDGNVVGDNLILQTRSGTLIDAGSVRGEQGEQGIPANHLIVTSGTRPTGGSLFEGLSIYETDTKRTYIYDGTAWRYSRGLWICTSGTRPSGPFIGLEIYETDTDNKYVWDGTAWTLPKNIAGGEIAYAEHTVAVPDVGTGGFDFCSTGAITVPRACKALIHGRVNITGTGTIPVLTAKVDGVTQSPRLAQLNDLSGDGAALVGTIRVLLTAGSHTFILGLSTTSGTVNIESAIDKATLTVVDIGGN